MRRQFFFDRAKSWAKSWAKNWAKFWTKFSGHFRASFTVQNDPPKFLPKFLPIYHSMSCHGSCDCNLKISSPRASGAWGAQEFRRTPEGCCNSVFHTKVPGSRFDPYPQCLYFFRVIPLGEKKKTKTKSPQTPRTAYKTVVHVFSSLLSGPKL